MFAISESNQDLNDKKNPLKQMNKSFNDTNHNKNGLYQEFCLKREIFRSP